MNTGAQPSMEAATFNKSKMAAKRKAVLAYVTKLFTLCDPSGTNTERIKKKLTSMSDLEFLRYMERIRDKKEQLYLVEPPFQLNLKTEDLMQAAEFNGVALFSRLWMTDPKTGRRMRTPEKYPIMTLPSRRMEQFHDKKVRVPDSDKTIDGLTGQVTGPDSAATLSSEEVQILHGKGLDATLEELIRGRGGDIYAYGAIKSQLESTGEASLGALDPNTRARSADMANIMLKSMHIDNNI